ncbi:MAG: radical SAM protein [Elusimicrobia bacterium]|nr:radical SAM protein [Elusimicrobiota bacterium]
MASSNRPLRVYLCDLTHDTVVLVSDTIPINVGFIAAYAKKHHGDAIDVRLFKYPQSVIDAIKQAPPDVIALSNYSWNSNLSERIAGYAKELRPDTLTVQGGTNFPHKQEHQTGYLLARPNTDLHVELEGEQAFSGLLSTLLAGPERGSKALDGREIPGCVYILPESRRSAKPVLVHGPRPERLRCLDDIPSPYLNGMLEHFFDGRLTPFLETNRGCPFLCTFCHTGSGYFNKINMFSLERVKEEIAYIAPRAAKHGIVNLHIADTNFAMYPRDREICEMLVKTQKDLGWPRQIMATTGKNAKERVIDITQIMGNTFSVNMSVQSMDETVLKNIKRDNIKIDHYVEVNKSLNEAGRATKGELIIGLPGETRESFVRGMRQIIEAGVSSVCTYSLMLLHGTYFKDPEYRDKFEIKGKYRIVPLNFGDYAGERVFDVEESGIANKDMSFDDYLWIRGLALMVEVMHNSRPFHELFKQASARSGITLFDFILRLYGDLGNAPPKVRELVKGFMDETRGELWDNEQDLTAHYRKEENYRKLATGEVGGNVIYKYKAMSLAFGAEAWIDYLASHCRAIASESKAGPEAETEIALLAAFTKNKLAGLLDAAGDVAPRSLETRYDLIAWKQAPLGTPLSAFLGEKPVVYDFFYTKEQLATRADQFTRYGTHANALSKIVTRVSNVESLFRKIVPRGQRDGDAAKEAVDQFTRYTLSN